MKLKFCGAAGAVTGSSHLLTLDSGFSILLDCGLYQGNDKKMKGFNEQWLLEPSEVDAVVLSHAHIDHTGRLPKLVKDGFAGPVYATHATRSLCAIMLLDSAKIQERDAEYWNKNQKKRKKKNFTPKEPLYTSKNVTQTLNNFVGQPYDQWFRIHKHVEVLYKDAGHILGSASVTLRVTENGKETLVGFTGDIGRPDRPILRDPQPMPVVDYLISESTYGAKVHEGKPAEESRFLDIIRKTCVDQKGKLIIPAFSVGRTQEIVYMLDQMETAGLLPKIPVYVDSPLSVNATTVFGAHPECYDNDLNQYLLIDDNPFGFNNLTYVRHVDVSKALNTSDDPCIIISSSGMMNAGRIRHHIFNNMTSKKNTLLIVGYCSPNTLGGIIRQGVEEIKMWGETKPLNMKVEIMDSFSAHADRNEILQFLDNQRGKVRKAFLVHGEDKGRNSLKELMEDNGFTKVALPTLGETFNLK